MRLVAFAAALSAAVSTAAGAAFAAPITIATNPQGSNAYVTGSVMAEIVGKDLGIPMTVVPLGGPTAQIPAMADGEYDFAFPNVTAAAEAYEGVGPFKGRPFQQLRIAATIYPLQLGILVRDDSGIKTVADLAGKRVASEFSTQKNLASFLATMMAMSGVGYDKVTPVPVQNGAASVDSLIDGQLDATIFSLGSAAISKADATVGVHFLSLADSGAANATLSKERPGSTIIPMADGAMPGIKGATSVVNSPIIILTTTNVSDDVVYRVVKSVAAHLPQFTAAQSQFTEVSLESMGQSASPIPFHEGAIRFFKEAGVWTK